MTFPLSGDANVYLGGNCIAILDGNASIFSSIVSPHQTRPTRTWTSSQAGNPTSIADQDLVHAEVEDGNQTDFGKWSECQMRRLPRNIRGAARRTLTSPDSVWWTKRTGISRMVNPERSSRANIST